MVKLGLLEQGKTNENINSLTTIEHIIDYAIAAEKKGFSRFWLTEHHYSFPQHPYTNPDILISIIAGMTERIKIGSAGVLINLHSPLSIVTNYKLLNNLFYDRIDLGLAYSLTDIDYINQLGTMDINDDNKSLLYEERTRMIWNLMYNEEDNFNVYGVVIPPFKGLKPKLWHLATSYKNTEFIIENQLNLCRSMFHNRGQNLENLDYDKNSLMKFKNKYNMVNGFFPEVTLSLAFYMSKSLNESEKYIHKLNKEHTGSNKPYVVIPTCQNHFYDLILEYQENFGIDEFILYDLEKDNAEKIQNLQIISELFHLKKTVA